MLAKKMKKSSHLGQGKQDRLINLLPLPVFAPLTGPGDPTRLLSAAKSTELFGTVAMLSGCVVPIGKCLTDLKS